MAEPRPNPESTSPPGSQKKSRGTIHLTANRCKGCGFCIAFCPPKVLAFSAAYNPQGYHYPELTNADGCTGCDLCGLYCPDFAIHGVMVKYAAKPPTPPAAPASGEGARQ
jgi:2-oxoglutarate ferredoxin oxidoreductase subunit delta